MVEKCYQNETALLYYFPRASLFILLIVITSLFMRTTLPGLSIIEMPSVL